MVCFLIKGACFGGRRWEESKRKTKSKWKWTKEESGELMKSKKRSPTQVVVSVELTHSCPHLILINFSRPRHGILNFKNESILKMPLPSEPWAQHFDFPIYIY